METGIVHTYIRTENTDSYLTHMDIYAYEHVLMFLYVGLFIIYYIFQGVLVIVMSYSAEC